MIYARAPWLCSHPSTKVSSLYTCYIYELYSICVIYMREHRGCAHIFRQRCAQYAVGIVVLQPCVMYGGGGVVYYGCGVIGIAGYLYLC